jgi:putative protein-disulfide isomerase
VATVEVSVFTDPACARCWTLEPVLRRLEVEFGAGLRITYILAGLHRSFAAPLDIIGEWLDAGFGSGMPLDPRLWLHDPPRSSHPACMAVSAAAEQGDPALYLRRVREGLLCERRRLDSIEALVDAARAVPGLSLERLRVDLGSSATVEAFGADLAAAREAAGEDGTLAPAVEVAGPGGGRRRLPGVRPWAEYRDAVAAAGATPAVGAAPSAEAALERYGRMAAAEVALVCDLPGPRASAELWRLAGEWRVRPERAGTGELWSLT